ncbi:hypothetical protein [Devosia sp.]|uniref:hypothetical protein n=1 Tax=Devosia sp. TaxID=1871048 RepID=UPI003BAADAB0
MPDSAKQFRLFSSAADRHKLRQGVRPEWMEGSWQDVCRCSAHGNGSTCQWAGSIIAGDIVLLALARDDGDAARVKDFHLSLHCSEDRFSQVLKELVSDGWLTMERDEADRRMRKVYASDRLRLLFDEYQRFLFEM